MSHAGLILGLPELEVERVDRNDAIAVYANTSQIPGPVHPQWQPAVRCR